MYAVFSTMTSDNPSLSFKLSSSLKACLRLFSTLVGKRILESHVLSLFILECIASSNLCPLESLLVHPIIVESPISYRARELGRPVLPSAMKVPHSGPLTGILSNTTKPQLPQMISPD